MGGWMDGWMDEWIRWMDVAQDSIHVFTNVKPHTHTHTHTHTLLPRLVSYQRPLTRKHGETSFQCLSFLWIRACPSGSAH